MRDISFCEIESKLIAGINISSMVTTCLDHERLLLFRVRVMRECNMPQFNTGT